MKHVLSLLLCVSVLVTPTAAQKTLSASKAWIKAPAAGATSAAAFVVIDNPTMYDVYVTTAETDAAASVKFEKPGASPGAKAETVAHITAPAYDSVELTPDGVHLILSELKKPLKAGDKVTLYLTTDSGVTLEVAAEVKP